MNRKQRTDTKVFELFRWFTAFLLLIFFGFATDANAQATFCNYIPTSASFSSTGGEQTICVLGQGPNNCLLIPDKATPAGQHIILNQSGPPNTGQCPVNTGQAVLALGVGASSFCGTIVETYTGGNPGSFTITQTGPPDCSPPPPPPPPPPAMCAAPAVPPPLPDSGWNQKDPNWSGDQYDGVLPPTTIGIDGCALTALTYSLNAAGQNYTPRTLNTALTFLYSGDYSTPLLPPLMSTGGRIVWGSAVLDASFGKLRFDDSKSGSSSPADLDRYLCDASPKPVIVQVINRTSGNKHFVVVTGQQSGGDYSIVDPGYLTSRTSLSKYNNAPFHIVGVVNSPSGTDPGELDFTTVDSATLLVTAPDGSQTGIDPVSGSILKASPQTAYFAIDNAVDTDQEIVAPTSTTYSVQLFLPVDGLYSVQVEGLKLGPYNLAVKAHDVNGLPQSFAILPGIANVGSRSTFQIQFTSVSGGHTTITAVATFQSALADVVNSERSGLITKFPISQVLTDLLGIAKDASYRHDRISEAIEKGALAVFKQVVIAETGKQITGVAPGVLQNDVTSLISQIP